MLLIPLIADGLHPMRGEACPFDQTPGSIKPFDERWGHPLVREVIDQGPGDQVCVREPSQARVSPLADAVSCLEHGGIRHAQGDVGESHARLGCLVDDFDLATDAVRLA